MGMRIATRRPELGQYTVVGYCKNTGEHTVDHVGAVSVRAAINAAVQARSADKEWFLLELFAGSLQGLSDGAEKQQAALPAPKKEA